MYNTYLRSVIIIIIFCAYTLLNFNISSHVNGLIVVIFNQIINKTSNFHNLYPEPTSKSHIKVKLKVITN